MRRRIGWTHATLCTATALALLGAPDRAPAQPGKSGGSAAAVAQLRIKVQGNAAASGVLSFPRQGPNAVVSVVATDAAGKPVTAGLSGAKWTTSDPDVLELYGGSSGASTRVVAQQDGRATLTVTALGKSASLTVVVGAARKEVGAGEVVPAYRVARLEVKQLDANDPDAQLSGRALLLGENGHNANLRVTAYAADGKPIPLADLPVSWATSDGDVIELMQETENEVRAVGRAPGQAKVSASIQGVTLALDGYVGDARSTADAGILAQAPTVSAPASAPTTTTTTTTTSTTSTTTTTAVAPTTTTVTAVPATVTATGVPATATTTTSTTSATPTTTVAAPAGVSTIEKAPATVGSQLGTAATTYAAPKGVQALYAGGGHIAAAWNTASGATGYTILFQTPQGWSGANPLDQQWYTDTTGTTRELTPGTYTIAVVAQYGGEANRSAPSQTVQVTVPRWYGKYRVSVLGFRANRATQDDPLETDGKRDEVYVRATAQERDAAGNAVGAGRSVQTYVHGDVNADDWKNASSPNYRIRAGSASSLGGIMSGDGFPGGTPWIRFNMSNYDKTFPLLVWEGDLYEGRNSVVVVPVIWESDQRPGTPPTVDFSSYSPERLAELAVGPRTSRRLMAGEFTTQDAVVLTALMPEAVIPAAVLAAPVVVPVWATKTLIEDRQLPGVPTVLTDAVLYPIDTIGSVMRTGASRFGGAVSFVTGLSSGVDNAVAQFQSQLAQDVSLVMNSKDRPIGIKPSGISFTFAPQAMTLDFHGVEQALSGNGPSGRGAGVWEVRYVDKVLTQGGNGDYSLYVQVQRVP